MSSSFLIPHRLRSSLCSSSHWFAAFTLLATFEAPAAPFHGTVGVLQNNNGNDATSVTTGLSFSTSAGVSIETARNSRGDYILNFPPSQDNESGVMITSVTENGRDNGNAGDTPGTFYPTSSIWRYGDEYAIAVSRYNYLVGLTDEFNANTAFAWFSKEDWLCGHAYNVTNGTAPNQFTGSDGFSFVGSTENFRDNNDGTFLFTPSAFPELGGTSAEGVLLVNGGGNEDNFALSEANPDGTFTIYSKDNGTDAAGGYELDPVAFVYLPVSEIGTKSLVAMGRVRSNGTTAVSGGNFTVTNPSTGVWHLEIAGQSIFSGTLLISPEGGENFNVDNTISYEWDISEQHWVIQSRDLIGYGLQNGFSSTEPMFSFAFFTTNRTIHVDDSATAGSNDGTSWTNAYLSLQDALAATGKYQEIRVAAGTYYPDEGGGNSNNDTTATFRPKSDVILLGGYPNGGGLRDPSIHRSILSGDIDKNGNFANNSDDGVVDISSTNSAAVLDGFTITGGADGGLVGDNGRLEIRNCTIEGNTDTGSGAGVDIRNTLSVFGGPSFIDCIFRNNSSGGSGGGFRSVFMSPTITGCIFEGNSAVNGGAVSLSQASVATITNCRFRGNYATREGGALRSTSQAKPTVINCDFSGNQADEYGGAVSANGSFNSFINCTFQGNDAVIDGGAVHNEEFSSFEFTNCVVWNNRAAGDSGTPGASIANINTGSPTYIHSLFEHLFLPGTGNLDGNSSANDPLFRMETDPAAAPTTDGDPRLSVGSPAIDAGDDADNPTTSDLDGFNRIQGDIDLGAYEFTVLHVREGLGSGTADGTSWSDAFPQMQDALAAVRKGQFIFVAAGTYYPDLGAGQTANALSSTFQLQSGVAIYGGFPAGGGSFAGRDSEANLTTLDGDVDLSFDKSGNAYHVLTAIDVDATAILDGFTIRGGNAEGTSTGDNRGGGLYCVRSSPTISHCRFEENCAALLGGAAYMENFSRPSFTNCSFQNNEADFGGAAYHITASSATFVDCSFTGNRANFYGGAARSFESSPSFLRCVFRSNEAVEFGGTMANSNSSPVVNACLYEGSESGSNGGADYNLSSSPVYADCVFAGNTGTSGGAIYNKSSGGSITNCTFQGNRSSFDGGGIYNEVSNPALTNVIVWNNRANGVDGTPASAVLNNSSSSVYRHCLIEGQNPAGVGNLDGGDPANDPRFRAGVDPSTAPAVGADLRLRVGSPAIDAGDNPAGAASATDLAGNPRLVNATVDLGALEADLVTVLWLTDSDDDSRPYGVEVALGTNPDVKDAVSSRNLSIPSFDSFGQAVLSFGRNFSAPPGTIWKLMRSTTLAPGSFEEIFSFDGSFVTVPSGVAASVSGPFTIFIVSPGPREFYRFEADYLPPSN